MKKLISFILTAVFYLGLNAQSATTSPGKGHWVAIDSGMIHPISLQTLTVLIYINLEKKLLLKKGMV